MQPALAHIFTRNYLHLLTLILLTWRIWWAPNDANKWQMGFNSAFKGTIFVGCSRNKDRIRSKYWPDREDGSGLLVLKTQTSLSDVLFMHKWILGYTAPFEIMWEMQVVQLLLSLFRQSRTKVFFVGRHFQNTWHYRQRGLINGTGFIWNKRVSLSTVGQVKVKVSPTTGHRDGPRWSR